MKYQLQKRREAKYEKLKDRFLKSLRSGGFSGKSKKAQSKVICQLKGLEKQLQIKHSKQLIHWALALSLGFVAFTGSSQAQKKVGKEASALVSQSSTVSFFDLQTPGGTFSFIADGEVVDIDSDGDLDLIGSFDLGFNINGNNGSFSKTSALLDLSSEIGEDLTVGDIDGDGDIDIIAAVDVPDADEELVLFTNEDGSFTRSSLGSFSYPRDFALFDLDGDADLDLVFSSEETDGDTLLSWVNDGAGSFSESTRINFSGGNPGIGDFDQDGDIDIIIADSDTGQTLFLTNDGDGSFSEVTGNFDDIGVAYDSYQVLATDFDDDGDLDVVLYGGNYHGFYENNGSGQFTLKEYSSSNYFYGAIAGDFDLDGDTDIVFAGSEYASISDQLWQNDGTNSFAQAGDLSVNSAYGLLVPFDFDEDGDLDLISTDEDGESTIVLNTTNNGSSGNAVPIVANPISDLTLNAGFGSTSVSLENVFNDADGDELTYAVAASGGSVTVAEAGGILSIVEIEPGSTTITVTAGDGNGGSVSDDFVVTVESGSGTGNITYGQVVQGSISVQDEIDTYQFNGVQGEVVQLVAICGSGPTIDPRIKLIAPSGAETVAVDDFSCTTFLLAELGETGTYTVEIDDGKFVGNDVGNYTLSLYSVSDLTNVQKVQFEEKVTASIDFHGETDQFAFEGTAGTLVQVSMNSAIPNQTRFDPVFDIYGPNGEVWQGADEFNRTADLLFELPVSGLYSIITSEIGFVGIDTGSYRLIVNQINPRIGGKDLTNSINVIDTLDVPGDEDLFFFFGVAGERMLIIQECGETNAPSFNLVTPSGEQYFASDFANCSAGLDLLLEETGEYAILSGSLFSPIPSAGSYNLVAHRVAPPSDNAVDLEIGSIYLDSLEVVGDSDLFSFSISENKEVEISVLSSQFHPVLQLYGPSGFITIVGNSFGPTTSLRRTLTEAGQYSFVIRDSHFVGLDAGTYELLVEAEDINVLYDQNGRLITWKYQGSDLVIQMRSGENEIMSLDVDVNQNGQIDENLDLSYGTSGSNICVSYLIDNTSSSTCGLPDSDASVAISENTVEFTIPREELFIDSSTDSLHFNFQFTDRSTFQRFRVPTGPDTETNLFSETLKVELILNSAPTVNTSMFTVDENASIGTAVGMVTASDPDGDVLSYSITAGNDLAAFQIDAATGAITVLDSGPLDFETTPSSVLSIEVSDGELSDNAEITINLNDLNELPSSEDAIFTIDENSGVGTEVGTVTASDPDGDVLSFNISAGNDLGAFQLNATTGAITVADREPLDFDTNPSFVLIIEVNDGELTDNATITINLNEIENRAPLISDATFAIDENSGVGTEVGTVTASDPDGDVLTYSIVQGTTWEPSSSMPQQDP